ncbi:flagellar basal body rod protein [Rhodoferax lacus]|uniref:Flagellar basal body rod protein n=1 Tax=Rhodoferax lacus TaxID=2184758 RepID=A0A3E1RGR9_9BURK|nr:flagellar basal body protein [Rhodoferax lacus]RFO98453.1 flagellar basal body rod protein [Rhodoferax lacus]
MASIGSIALSGMNAAQTQLNASANNVANAQTEGYKRQEVLQTPQGEGGVSASVVASKQSGPALETDLVNQLQAKNAFLANLAVFKTGNAMAGALLDTKA